MDGASKKDRALALLSQTRDFLIESPGIGSLAGAGAGLLAGQGIMGIYNTLSPYDVDPTYLSGITTAIGGAYGGDMIKRAIARNSIKKALGGLE